MHKEQVRLVDALSKELEEGNLAIFAGAGFSRSAGFVDWKTLLKPIAEDLDLDVEKEWDLVTLAQYHSNINQANRNKLNQILVDQFSVAATPSENHRILARLPISTYWTTNYDDLVERSLANNAKVADVKYTVKQLATTKPNRDAVVYKMHGDAAHAADAVLIRDDYERYHLTMQPFITALSGDLVSKTFLFIGFSFTDPNLEYILSRVRIHYGKDQRQHHCILRRVKQEAGEAQPDFDYRKRKEQLFAVELLRVGIKATFVDEFSEITDVLRALEHKHKRRTVFISGAAHDYSPWTQAEAERFVFELSREINKHDYRVISGFGLGIGSAVISGVLEATIMAGRRLDNEQLVLRPFPQSKSGERSLPDLWREYRNNMLDHAGIAIFLFGNKVTKDGVVESNGMREEFEIAREKGVFVIPIGITGSISRKLWEEVVASFTPEAFPKGEEIRALLNELGDAATTLESARGKVLQLMKLV